MAKSRSRFAPALRSEPQSYPLVVLPHQNRSGTAIERSHGDIAVSITGFAGPGGPDDEPGLVHFGCLRRGGDVVHREEHFGDIGRGPVRLKCLDVALEMLDRNLEQQIP